jgi:hypothetical protein
VAFAQARRLLRPEGRAEVRLWLIAAPVAAAAAVWTFGFVTRPAELRFADATPLAVAECLGFILVLTIVPGLVALRVLRQGATTSPAISGALALLAASAAAATGYSLYCTQDNPVFFVTWYGAAITVATAAGAAVGPRALRW